MKVERNIFETSISADIILDRPILEPNKEKPQLYILLHGFMETAEDIYKLIKPALPENSIVLAPNGMFPVPLRTSSGFKMKFAWYFYDNTIDKYYIFYDRPALFIKNLIEHLDLENTDKTIIGYSQGGYLAPFAAEQLTNVQQVIGLACNFKDEYLKLPCDYRIDAIHGDQDLMVNFENAKSSHKKLKAKGQEGTFNSLAGEGHRLSEAFIKKLSEIKMHSHN